MFWSLTNSRRKSSIEYLSVRLCMYRLKNILKCATMYLMTVTENDDCMMIFEKYPHSISRYNTQARRRRRTKPARALQRTITFACCTVLLQKAQTGRRLSCCHLNNCHSFQHQSNLCQYPILSNIQIPTPVVPWSCTNQHNTSYQPRDFQPHHIICCQDAQLPSNMSRLHKHARAINHITPYFVPQNVNTGIQCKICLYLTFSAIETIMYVLQIISITYFNHNVTNISIFILRQKSTTKTKAIF